MITEDYVSFETAKLLKEKGFDEYTAMVYNQNRNFMPNGAIEDTYQTFYSAPTLQMAMKWLRERNQIFVNIQRCKFKFFFTIESMNEPSENEYSLGHFREFERKTYEEAADAAIKYCLKNLI